MGEDADIHALRAADQAVQGTSHPPLPEAFVHAVAYKDLGDPVGARESQNRFNGVVTGERMDLTAEAARLMQRALDAGMLLRPQTRLLHIGDEEVAVEAVGIALAAVEHAGR